MPRSPPLSPAALSEGFGAAALTAAAVALAAPAKINLALHVLGRRADGYHLLDGVAVFAEIADRVAISAADRLELTVTGPFASHAPGGPTDLAWRAAERFFAHVGRPPGARIEVAKIIPAGAGLGGGSADAAAVLSGLNRLCGAGLPPRELDAIALRLGADVPMCLAGRALRARGIGERLEAVEGWPDLPLVLLWPGRAVSTAAVFAALDKRQNPPLPEPPAARTPAEVAAWLAGCRNDLERPAVAMAAEIGDALAALRRSLGCLIARMSGSGSACFGIFADTPAAERAAEALRLAHPQWWVAATQAR